MEQHIFVHCKKNYDFFVKTYCRTKVMDFNLVSTTHLAEMMLKVSLPLKEKQKSVLLLEQICVILKEKKWYINPTARG